MKLKVAIIGTNGLPGRYGGWDQIMEHLTLNLKNEYSFYVYTSSHNAVKGLKEYNDAKLIIIPLKANGIQSVFYDGISLIHAAIYFDILLVLGTSGCIFLPLIKMFRKKIILNPDGAEWKRGKWSKPVKWFLKLSEKFGIKFSDIIVADNVKIQEYIKEEYKKDSKLIEYGGDHALYVPMSEEVKVKYSLEPNNYAFKVCRIEPENNIHIILEAFKESRLKLVIIGNWNFSKYGKNLRIKYSSFSNLKLLDPIYEQDKLNEIRSNCKLYIHGHSVGGTNPSLVEAMNLGLCCIVYNVDYNLETTENNAIYFNSAEELRDIVNELDNKSDLTEYKNKMIEIAKRRYIWKLIIEKYSNLFTLD